MTPKDKKTLIQLLDIWFNTINHGDTNFWYREPVGKHLKQKLKSIHRWKNLKRGTSFRKR